MKETYWLSKIENKDVGGNLEVDDIIDEGEVT